MTYSGRPNVLYITYDGVLEPLGQSQVVGYLERLAADWPIHLVSFEKRKDREDAARMDVMQERLSRAGISWTPLNYHKSPTAPATAYDIVVGTLVAMRIALRHKVGIVHARSYVSAMIALAVKRFTGAKFLFDMRGFWADERIDGGLWPRDGLLYRTAKSLERKFLEAADHVVTVTHSSKREIERFPYLNSRLPALTVVPTCANLERFTPPKARGNGSFTLGYVGSVGMSYLLDEVFAFFHAVAERQPNARLLFVNRSQHAFIDAAAKKAGVDPLRLEIVSAEHNDVPSWIAKMTVGVAFYRPAYAEIARCPVKLAEYLGCGIPCVGNVGVGDMEEYLEGRRVGVALNGFSPFDHASAVERLLRLLDEPNISERCVETARDLFALEAGVIAYGKIYASLNDAADARRTIPAELTGVQ